VVQQRGSQSLSRRRVARTVVRFVVLGAAAGTLAGYSAYTLRPARSAPDGAGGTTVAVQTHASRWQASNAATKTDRLPLLRQASFTMDGGYGGYALASAEQSADLGRLTDMVAAAPMISSTESSAYAPSKPTAESKLAALAPAPHDKPKPAAMPRESGDILGDGQIAGLKNRLRLTSDQIEYWPAVESALRDVARTQLHHAGAKRAHGGKVNIDVNSAEVQKLIWAAMPLLMRLREDQKREVRKLARVIGLEQVASQI